MTDFDLVVSEFMEDFGGVAYIVKETDVGFDAVTGENTITTELVEVEAILLDYPLKSDGLKTENGKLIQAVDKYCYIRPTEKVDSYATPLDIAPSKDLFEMAGKKYNIVVAKEINTNGTDSILFELYLKR